VKRPTKKQREQQKADEAAARNQFARWISTKATVSLIFAGPFFAAGMEGHLEQSAKDHDCLEFFGFQTSFRTSISLDRCLPIPLARQDHTAVWLQGPTPFAILLSDRDGPKPDLVELLKASGGRPN
jgi:hypothetical protein